MEDMEDMTDDIVTQVKDRAKEEASRQVDNVKQDVGPRVVDATEEYFPEETKERRRRDMVRGFLVGVGVGFLLRYALGR